MRPLLVVSLLVLGLLVGRALPRPAAPLTERVLAGPICEPARPTAATCEVDRHDSCWSELDARVAPHPTTAVGFEGVTEPELPENFGPIVEREVTRCDPAAVVEVTDCSTYPCMAAVRPGVDWFEHTCTFDTHGDAEVIVLPLDVDCPGGPERMFVTTLLDEASARAALGIAEGEDGNGLVMGLFGQRVDTLLEMWPCTGS